MCLQVRKVVLNDLNGTLTFKEPEYVTSKQTHNVPVTLAERYN